MCGIVAYFGTTGNNLTRPLTAMSAIVYRAPDSTGIGFFGDDREPLRARKALGTVTSLITTLTEQEAYPNAGLDLMKLWSPECGIEDLVERQRRLLAFQGFSTEPLDTRVEGKTKYDTLDDLLDLDVRPPRTLAPGRPGRIEHAPGFSVRDREQFRELIRYLINHYDLPFLAIQTLLGSALSKTLSHWRDEGRISEDPLEVLKAFDRLFETSVDEMRSTPGRFESEYFASSPAIEENLWDLLRDTHFHVPEDYDRDGVRGVFRLLDAALLCRLPFQPELRGELQQILESVWKGAAQHRSLDWQTLYSAEKSINVYGWAAASAFIHLHQKVILPDLMKNAPAVAALSGQPASGETHPVWLHYLSTPLIAHGRWALQSPVNLRNAHPFSDASGLRSIVLNGQFSTRVETEVHDFLERVCGHTFRSGNSSEYLALLWGHYAKLLQEEKERYQAIDTQVDAALQDYTIGSQTIDHRVYREIKDKSPSDLDEQAFLEAARRMVGDGGQVAAAGISLQSPRRLYVAVHNRPALVVQRADGNDFMVVSDINAAVGLFPQRLIHKKAVALRQAHHEYRKALRELEESGADKAALEACEKKYRDTESAILKAFEIVVYPLEGEEIFARIEAGFEKGRFRRNARITDFQGNHRPDVKPFRTVLNPLRTRKDLFRSFYESHLHEIPERLEGIIQSYARDEQGPPHFELRHRLLHRRFGQRLTSLKRILLVGMGSAHNTGLMARDFLQSRLPDQEILVLRPIEIENIPAAIVPEQDLVVLLSWSSTTADMVQFAKDLEAHHVVMLGITEKSFADMALVTRKSAGVIQVLSGEEVTVAAIKSTLCMLMCVELLGLWLMSRLGKTEEAVASLDKLRRMPEVLANILEDPSTEEFSKELASRSAKSTVCLVFDALESTAAGHEIAGKLQDNSWYALGKCLDYRDLWIHEGPKDMNRELVLVNATHQGRLREALNVMKRLYMGDVPFAAVSYEHPEQDEVCYFSKDLCLNLPKLDDDLQPFADLMFYYRFAYLYGLAHGRTAEDAPRNRSKSVTVTRSRPKRIPSPSEELRRLVELVPKTEPGTQLEPLSRETLWEREASFEVEKRYYREMRRLADLVSRKELSGTIFQSPSQSLTKLNKAVFEDLPEEGGEVVFVSLDRSAHAAAKNLVSRWGRFLRYFLRVAPGGESLSHFKEDTILIFIATRPPEESVLAKLREQIFVPCLWFGPEIPEEFAQFFHASLGCFIMPPAEGLTENDLLYAGLSCLIVSSWRDKRPEKARIVEEHFAQCGRAVQAILNDDALRRAALDAMAENRDYPSAYFSVPPGGTGLAWVVRFDELGCLPLEQHCYGETAYGPLVTVDPRVDKKFVALLPVSEMISQYGEERVSEWERRYLGDLGIDAFLEQPTADLSCRIEKPFFAEGRWYLPALRPGYDAAEDTLIIIDAAVHRRFDRALDELATYGVRYARMLIVSQRAFFQEQQKSLACQPMDRLLLLPTLEGYTDEAVPIPEILLPFAMNLLAVQLCAGAAKARDLPFEPVSRDAVFLRCFGPLGDLINRDRLDLDYFHSRLIEPLRHLTPVMHSLEGTGRYSVLEIRDEDRLHRLADQGLLYNPDTTVEHFRAQQSLAPPFFLVRPNRETFDARILEAASQTFQGDDWNMWHEAHGDTWDVLYHRTPDIRDDGLLESLLLLPFAGASWEDGGRLYHVSPRYFEWDHAQSMAEQLHISSLALGLETNDETPLGARYREIVGRFNDGMTAQGHVWDDRLFTLVKRSLLFRKSSRVTVDLLLERVQTLLDDLAQRRPATTVQTIAVALETSWPELQGQEDLNDAERWEALRGMLG